MAAGNGRTKSGGTQRYTREDWTDFFRTGPTHLAGRFLRRFWHPIYRAQDLPRKRAVPLKIMDEQFTLYRGEDGTPHAVGFRCAHRATQLSTGWVEGDNLRCRFHGWMYDGSGQCVEQPSEPEPFCEKVRIRGYPTQEYLGYIFVYMGEGAPPPLARYLELEYTEGILEPVKPKLAGSNYFRRVEQIVDEVHLLWAHRYEKLYSEHATPLIEAEETEYGVAQYGRRPNGLTKVTHYLMPYTMYVTNTPLLTDEFGPRERIMWKVPVDDDHYWNSGVMLLRLRGEAARRYLERRAEHEEAGERANTPAMLQAILAGRLTLEEVEDRSDISHLEDDVVLAGIGPVADGPHPEQLGRTDAGVILVRKIWERELRALSQGRPLKEWTHTGRLRVEEGI